MISAPTRRSPLTLTLALALALGLATTARAEEPAAAPAPADDGHFLSLTLSPIHLAMPVLEVTAEYRVLPKLGVAGFLGAGQYTQETEIGGTVVDEDTFLVLEVGAQVRYYVLGDFDHGMQLGAEVLYLHLSGDDLSSSTVSGSGAGVAVGPFLGYKIATRIGFTFDVQLGYQVILVSAEASNDQGQSATSDETSGSPLLNLNVGWSF
ncbi:MAG: hypothetical protein RBU45_11285 [Myxococcota bacterium]|jgi:hypothetical protein|nr:hypothetical protein [Myxococcota bacterium]